MTRVPALTVRPHTAAEVSAAVITARSHDLPLSVLAGGHDWAGRSVRDGGLVIDLAEMRQVVVSPQIQVAAVEGGATAGDVVRAAQPLGLTAVTGTTGGVGMAGLTLGGGYGPLNGRFGLALDNLLGVEVVLADGRHVIANPASEPDLYWALRGGGGNFGVATSLNIRLHAVPEVLSGFIIYPWTQAADVWTQLNEILHDGPDEMTVQSGILPDSDGRPLVFLSPVWSSELSRGHAVVEQLLRLGTPLSSEVAQRRYADMLGFFDAQTVTGRHYALRTRSMSSYTPAVIAALVAAPVPKLRTLLGVHPPLPRRGDTRSGRINGIRNSPTALRRSRSWPAGIPTTTRHRNRRGPTRCPQIWRPRPYRAVTLACWAPRRTIRLPAPTGPDADRLLAVKNRYDPDHVSRLSHYHPMAHQRLPAWAADERRPNEEERVALCCGAGQP